MIGKTYNEGRWIYVMNVLTRFPSTLYYHPNHSVYIAATGGSQNRKQAPRNVAVAEPQKKNFWATSF